MIPSILAGHVQQGITDFLRTTFPITTPFFSHILEDFLAEPGNVFKGPFLDIQLPYQQGKGGPNYFPNLFWTRVGPSEVTEFTYKRLSGVVFCKLKMPILPWKWTC